MQCSHGEKVSIPWATPGANGWNYLQGLELMVGTIFKENISFKDAVHNFNPIHFLLNSANISSRSLR